MLTEKQKERFAELFEGKLKQPLIENKEELLKLGEKARKFISSKQK